MAAGSRTNGPGRLPRVAAGALAALILACALPGAGDARVRTVTSAVPAQLAVKAHTRRCATLARVSIDGRRWARITLRRHAVERVIRRRVAAGRHRVRVTAIRSRHCRRPRLVLDRIRAVPLSASAAPGPRAPAPQPPAPATANPLAGERFFVDPDSNPARTAAEWRAAGRDADAAAMDKVAAGAQATWFGDWDGADPSAGVRAAVSRAHAAGAVPVLVAYDIPGRDCGSYSAGGAASDAAYRTWIDGFAAGLDGPAAVVVEPDALAGLDCADPAARLALLRYAVETLSARPGAAVYLDAGNASWQPAAVIADRLRAAGIDRAQGFSLNVSNFDSTASELAYGRSVSALVGGKHFVIDTSRNGQGPAPGGEWCNPAGRGLGVLPTPATGEPLADAFLWVKAPGESDGTCNGGPSAGTWWPEYALGLAQRAAF